MALEESRCPKTAEFLKNDGTLKCLRVVMMWQLFPSPSTWSSFAWDILGQALCLTEQSQWFSYHLIPLMHLSLRLHHSNPESRISFPFKMIQILGDRCSLNFKRKTGGSSPCPLTSPECVTCCSLWLCSLCVWQHCQSCGFTPKGVIKPRQAESHCWWAVAPFLLSFVWL